MKVHPESFLKHAQATWEKEEAAPVEEYFEVETRGRKPVYDDQEAAYRKARQEYEQSSASLLSIAEKYRFKYGAFRYYLEKRHPESRILHSQAVQRDREPRALGA